jgi:hypothetical protein
MTFNGKNNQPRKRSTNTRALSTRLSQLQREMNPQVVISGNVVAATPQNYVTRKILTYASMSNSTLTVTGTTLNVPDGAKVLKVQVRNLTGRTLKVTVPQDTALMIAPADGSSTVPFGGSTKCVAAPLSRFPKSTIQVPDLLAAPVDKVGTATLFTVGSQLSSSADQVEFMTTVRYTC